jgi:predicted transcriptional regulator
MEKAGFNKIAISLAIRKLLKKNFISYNKQSDQNGNDYFVYSISDVGEDWLIRNEKKLALSNQSKSNPDQPPDTFEDDVPF